MTKIDFIDLADYIKEVAIPGAPCEFHQDQINYLADFCYQQNPAFNRDRWLGYIAGHNGKNGGKIK